MKPASRIEIDKPARESIARLLTRRLKDEFDLEIAPMDSHRLLDFLAETVGPYFYNQGLYDAQAVLKDRIDALSDAIESLERPAPR
jgi:uncharacterized protein (DUF2164 family)